ncbi:YaeQ family protein [Leucobacter sp. cx-42]|uniref:YaeQ family protein n=1 Tax=unclassified Leucobacter TaxID=2621730 RepID=UPI00165E602F|nr:MULTISPECIES: YaeQ family protein [unclassified Leucobacter]MBC9955414.1 YaeQ family protein [Leucobacter sp. cx-42]
MAIGSTILNFSIQLADIDRGVYEDFSLRVARHPSETEAFMVTRVLAYCLEFQEGIDFGGGVSTTDEPTLWVKDLTGKVTSWIEIGAPDAARMHFGSKLADYAAVYTHRDPAKVLRAWEGKTIYNAEALVVHSFDSKFIDELAGALDRRNTMSVSRTEGTLYVELNGASFETAIGSHPAA